MPAVKVCDGDVAQEFSKRLEDLDIRPSEISHRDFKSLLEYNFIQVLPGRERHAGGLHSPV